jgi:predicted DNA-binding transcriptional regulator AlpA
MKGKKYLRAAQVRARYGDISDMTLWRRIQSGNFPKPNYINGRRYWPEEELDAYDARVDQGLEAGTSATPPRPQAA